MPQLLEIPTRLLRILHRQSQVGWAVHGDNQGDPRCRDCVRLAEGPDLTCGGCKAGVPWSQCSAVVRRAAIGGTPACLGCLLLSNTAVCTCQ